MFGVYFGKYLEDKGILTKEQYDMIMEDSKNTRVKMGLLAVEAGYMTTAQADEVNNLQQVQDKRFGDIAVEKGYLSDDQVVDLLEKQGDVYLLFVQALIEHDILTLDKIQGELNAYKKSEHYSALDIEAIKSGDVDRIVQVFIKDEAIPRAVKEYVALLARNVVRFVDSDFRMERVEKVTDYTSSFVAAQEMVGDYKIFTGLCGDGSGIKTIAQEFAQEQFETVDLDVLDAACEFLNCNNGLYAIKMGNDNINIDMCPPIMKSEVKTLRSEGEMFRLPFYVKGTAVDLIICIGEDCILS